MEFKVLEKVSKKTNKKYRALFLVYDNNEYFIKFLNFVK